jgi:hypothetical protein
LLLMMPAFQMITEKRLRSSHAASPRIHCRRDTSRPCCNDPYRCSNISSMWSIRAGTRRSR